MQNRVVSNLNVPNYSYFSSLSCVKNPPKPKNHWNSLDNQRLFINELGDTLGVKKIDDWYSITTRQIRKLGGGGILKRYNGSLYTLLQTVYPDYQWITLNNKTVPQHFWSNIENMKIILHSLIRKYRISEKKDWYRISASQIQQEGGGYLIQKYGGLTEVLRLVYSDQKWNQKDIQNRTKKSSQRWLKLCLSQMWNNSFLVLENYQEQTIQHTLGNNIELDVYIPNLNMGFEYQGQHHYDDLPNAFPPIEVIKKRDAEKSALCNESINLVVIPYWWDNSYESIHITLLQLYPHFVPPLQT